MIYENIESIVDTIVDATIDNPIFVRFGLYGLFMNGALSPVLSFPPELTSSALIFAGESKTNVSLLLVLGWIIGGMFGYYLGLSSNKFVKWRHITSSKQDDKRGYKLLMKYGWAIVLVSPWIPILGDLIPIITGVKKYDFKKYMIAMSTGKTIKAVAIVFLSSWFLPLISN